MKERIDRSRPAKIAHMLTGIVLTMTVVDSIAAMDVKETQTDIPPPASRSPQLAIEDLVRAEAALALSQLQERETPAFSPKTGYSSQDKRNEVRSIFGVGRHLYAELVLSSKPYLFVSGQSRPVEGPDREWKLQRIQPPCIHLKHEDRPTMLCLGASIE